MTNALNSANQELQKKASQLEREFDRRIRTFRQQILKWTFIAVGVVLLLGSVLAGWDNQQIVAQKELLQTQVKHQSDFAQDLAKQQQQLEVDRSFSELNVGSQSLNQFIGKTVPQGMVLKVVGYDVFIEYSLGDVVESLVTGGSNYSLVYITAGTKIVTISYRAYPLDKQQQNNILPSGASFVTASDVTTDTALQNFVRQHGGTIDQI